MSDIYAGWEPSERGAQVYFNDDDSYDIRTDHLREMRDDIEEAIMRARGLAKHEVFAQDIDAGDFIVLMGDAYKVRNTLKQLRGKEEEQVIQFELNTYSPVHTELLFPPDQFVTVWRAVE